LLIAADGTDVDDRLPEGARPAGELVDGPMAAAADAVAVEDVATAAAALTRLRAEDGGRAALLIAADGTDVDDRLPEGARPAGELVDGPMAAAARNLLRRTAVVEDLDAAQQLIDRQPYWTAVTRDGDLLSATLAHGGSAGAPSPLETQAAVAEAARGIEELDARCEELTHRLAETQEHHRELGAEVEQLAALRRQGEKQRAELAGALGRSGGAARAAAGEAERATTAAAKAESGLAEARAAAEELAERLATAEELADSGEDEPNSAERDRLAAAGTAARQTELESRLAVRTHEERVRGLAGRADQLDRAARAERETRARAAERRARARRESAVAGAVATGARHLLGRIEETLAAAETERAAVEADRAAREGELRQFREHGRELQAELDRLVDAGHRDEVLRAEKRLRIEQLEAKALEEFGIEAAELLTGYGPDLPVPAPPAEDGESAGEERPYVRAEVEKRLKAAERAYQQLGKVNPLALEEFAALEARHQFLGEQLDDLRKSRRDLLDIVRDVDARVEQLFTAAYHDTAAQFEGVFARLFPGGEGRLVLTDPENMLTTGVEVEARPPGKKVKRLSLLSGGERSLTAVALLVSIFKARPSPFYVMDEVEAALDETNLRRLIAIMEELRESSQLIVITHQKLTMESADALYGVTMKGDGISQVISQRLRMPERPPQHRTKRLEPAQPGPA
ncbi:AAA family ATPase, partial [Kitasatospora sp. NPDC051984]|uniref:AAA family ATPase n=1 Tax=Kitasatospora sp. NPDC051984 TaxID=3364059 RepID=UPI0037C92C62